MTDTRTALLTYVSLVLLAAPAAAQNQVTGQLRGSQEVPAISTPAAGFFVGVINDAAQTITFQLFYQGLSGPVSAAHIHFGQRDVNGGIVAFLCGGGGQPACPASGPIVVSGTITAGNIMAVSSQGIAAGEFSEVAAALRAGLGYANVHTSVFGGGEIRGQLAPTTPAPRAPAP